MNIYLELYFHFANFLNFEPKRILKIDYNDDVFIETLLIFLNKDLKF